MLNNPYVFYDYNKNIFDILNDNKCHLDNIINNRIYEKKNLYLSIQLLKNNDYIPFLINNHNFAIKLNKFFKNNNKIYIIVYDKSTFIKINIYKHKTEYNENMEIATNIQKYAMQLENDDNYQKYYYSKKIYESQITKTNCNKRYLNNDDNFDSYLNTRALKVFRNNYINDNINK
jgi:hypothetical protein